MNTNALKFCPSIKHSICDTQTGYKQRLRSVPPRRDKRLYNATQILRLVISYGVNQQKCLI